MARVVLTALQYDHTMKSAMNVRRSDAVVEACQELNLVAEGFDRADEPGRIIGGPGISRAIEMSVKHSRGVPDVILSLGSVAKEPMAYILGHSAQHVAEKVAQISSTIR
jgi:hydroxymethylpyrimidine/phosphomethylpyrimidine kinase